MDEKKKPEKHYRYFVRPRNKHTNDVLAAQLDQCGEYVCADGKRHFMFEAPNHDFIAYLQRSKSELNIDFEVFIQEGNKRPRPWPFNAAKRQHKPRVKAA